MIVAKTHMRLSELSLKEQVFKLLKKNPLLTAKPICKILGLPFKKYGSYINNLKTQWKNSLRFEQASIAYKGVHLPSFHNVQAVVHVGSLSLKREDALEKGWMQSKAKNKFLMWKARGLGRVVWHPTTGRVILYIRKPATQGKANELFVRSFFWTGLIKDPEIQKALIRTIECYRGHAGFRTTSKKKLPSTRIELFKDSNGMIFVTGDYSHPYDVELQFCMPKWAERNEQLLARILKMMEPPQKPETSPQKREPYYVS